MGRLHAFASAHSHAFQRALRGRAQRPVPGVADDFWGWREAMYQLAATLTPESIYDISLIAYRELAAAGVLTVGEFHYVHHQPDGTPYDDRTVMSDAVIRAAKDAGLRIALLRVIYARSSKDQPPQGVQRRFCDSTLEQGLADIESLEARYVSDSDVSIGVAPHSIRAVPPNWLDDLGRFAFSRGRPLHMHVAEQPADVDACIAETKRRPVELLSDLGLLCESFVAVHATHITPDEARLLGEAGSFVCLCPTTERDLGDGRPDVTELVKNHVRLCLGVDGYVLCDLFEEMRGVELGERLRNGRRFGEGTLSAERLWKAASDEGAIALGFDDAGGFLEVDRKALALSLVDDEHLLEALVFSGSSCLVDRVVRM
jgi:formiminoglutamate deiminase